MSLIFFKWAHIVKVRQTENHTLWPTLPYNSAIGVPSSEGHINGLIQYVTFPLINMHLRSTHVFGWQDSLFHLSVNKLYCMHMPLQFQSQTMPTKSSIPAFTTTTKDIWNIWFIHSRDHDIMVPVFWPYLALLSCWKNDLPSLPPLKIFGTFWFIHSRDHDIMVPVFWPYLAILSCWKNDPEHQ